MPVEEVEYSAKDYGKPVKVTKRPDRKTFGNYFHDDVTDYTGARAMVNANGDAKDVAEFAELFEKISFEARLKPLVSKP